MFWNKIKCRIRLETIQEHPEVNAPILLLWLIDLIKLFRIAIPLPNHPDLSSLIHPVLSRYVPFISSWYNIHPPFHSSGGISVSVAALGFVYQKSILFICTLHWLTGCWFISFSRLNDWLTERRPLFKLQSRSELPLRLNSFLTTDAADGFPCESAIHEGLSVSFSCVSITLLLAHTTSEAREWYSR